ncbi:hypothetical protein VHEMI08021 [[Torrubiella] hemipterigena]|uniref:Uncharacterized protein n=1 Tax=[Torrubiella] hemipterigena TaxID=1531966 RepID=A0A0A1TMF4_9HYPO|nr:hypothetical protein VHEMI08021 [[Torrubiella] hemipterigena]
MSAFYYHHPASPYQPTYTRPRPSAAFIGPYPTYSTTYMTPQPRYQHPVITIPSPSPLLQAPTMYTPPWAIGPSMFHPQPSEPLTPAASEHPHQPATSPLEASPSPPPLPAPPATRSFHIRIILISASTTILSDAKLELASLTAQDVQGAVACVAAQNGVSDEEDTSVRVMRTKGQVGVHCHRGRVVVLGEVVNVVDSDGDGWEDRLNDMLRETGEHEDIMVVVEMREERKQSVASNSRRSTAASVSLEMSGGRQSAAAASVRSGRESVRSVHSRISDGGQSAARSVRSQAPSPASVHSDAPTQAEEAVNPAPPARVDGIVAPPSRQPSQRSGHSSPRTMSLHPSQPGSPAGSIRSQRSRRSSAQHDANLGDAASLKSVHSNIPA